MLVTTRKYLQRRLITYINSNVGCTCVLWMILALICFVTWIVVATIPISSTGNQVYDNIASLNTNYMMEYEPIDVVYTWVNGSDPMWLAKKDSYFQLFLQQNSQNSSIKAQENSTSNISSHNSANSSSHNITIIGNSTDDVDDRNSNNRYRDSGELRYSLRSLVKFAPWIRRIYIVTDNQIPNWLNLETDKLFIISHDQIFPNRSHLPVFSSPAIESHLHLIPGLSKQFIYFNDDVLLGAPVLPEDFALISGVQKLYMSWDIPKCAPGCSDSWIGDGFCDKACNVSSCDFDFPDCVNATATATSISSAVKTAGIVTCAKGCPDSWLADKVCDQKCKTESCAYDFGDCGGSILRETIPGVAIFDRSMVYMQQHVPTMVSDSLDINSIPLVLTVPYGTKSLYFNLSSLLPCENIIQQGSICNETHAKKQFTYNTAEHSLLGGDTDQVSVIHHAVFIAKQELFIATLYHGQENAPESSVFQFPQIFTIKVHGYHAESNSNSTLSFRFKVIRDIDGMLRSVGVPQNYSHIKDAYTATCNSHVTNEHFMKIKHTRVLSRPFQMFPFTIFPRHETGIEYYDGVGLQLSVHPSSHIADIPLSDMAVQIKYTHGKHVESIMYPFCEGIIGPDIETLSLVRFNNLCLHKNTLGELLQAIRNTIPTYDAIYKYTKENDALPTSLVNLTGGHSDEAYITLAVPMPKELHWTNINSSWIYSKIELLNIGADNVKIACVIASYKWGHHVPAPNVTSNYTHEEVVASVNNSTKRRLAEDRLYSHYIKNIHKNHVDKVVNVDFVRGYLGKLLSASYEQLIRVINQLILYLYPDVTPDMSHIHRRLDTYAQSLIHVNRLYTKVMGHELRKVPAHMPHFINRDVITEMQQRWPEEWDATSSNRFRSNKDMQYSFAYYHYLINRHKLKVGYAEIYKYLARQIDTNNDGYIDQNEFLSLAHIVKGSPVQASDIDEYYNCIAANTSYSVHKEESTQSLSFGRIHQQYTFYPYYTIDEVMNCSVIYTNLRTNIEWSRIYPSHILGSDKDVAFEMIGENYTHTLMQLNSVRARQSKFICINDNIHNMTDQLHEVIHQFYESFFPIQSIFELPIGTKNPTLYIDEYRSLKGNRSFLPSQSMLPIVSHQLVHTHTNEKINTLINGLRNDIGKGRDANSDTSYSSVSFMIMWQWIVMLIIIIYFSSKSNRNE